MPLWQFQGFCVDLTHCTWSKCRFADAMLAASCRMAAGRGSIVVDDYRVVPTRALPNSRARVPQVSLRRGVGC